MNKSKFLFFTIFIISISSCKKYLDINTNPNAATSATPEVILPQALAGTGARMSSFNDYGAQLGGFMANAGGYGGFGSNVTYNFASSDYTGLWENTFDNIEDYQNVVDQTNSQLPSYAYFNAAARVMRAMDYQLLVDTYNDIPYTNAALGKGNLTPEYTKAEDVYKDLAVQLDSAITIIETADNSGEEIKPLSGSDVLFAGDMTKWKQFANTLKLRLIVRATGKVQFANTNFDAVGFLTTDALINPGYTRDNGKQNPEWNTWAFTNTGSTTNRAWLPTDWIFSWYDGTHLTDEGRGAACFLDYPKSATNQLGFESNDVPACPAGSVWYSGPNRDGATAGNYIGILKGPNAGQPVLTAGESYFLQAEAVLRHLLTSANTVDELFDKGILASYTYLYTLPDNKSFLDGWDPQADFDLYKSDNPDSYLVHLELATSDDERLEAIITQKYIALNMVNSNEAWNEYRRTHYPKIVDNSQDGTLTFASLQTTSTRPDRLPTRILYPTSELSYNAGNVPTDIDPFKSLIFWAQ